MTGSSGGAATEPARFVESGTLTPWLDFARTLWAEAIILSCFAPLVTIHFMNLWRYQHYQFFPIVLIAFPYLVWAGVGQGVSRGRKPPLAPVSLVLLGWVGLLLAVLYWSPNMAMLSATIAAGGLLMRLSQHGLVRNALALWIVLLFLVRPPANLDLTLIFQLQTWTSSLASLLLDGIGLTHVMLGNVIWVDDKSYFVEQACSGINGLFSLTAVTAICLALTTRSLLHHVVLLAAAPLWACCTNVLRVAAIVWCDQNLQVDLLRDPAHTVFGLILFGLGLLMVASTDQLLLALAKTRPEPTARPAKRKVDRRERSGTRRRQPMRNAMVLGGLFGVLLLGQISVLALGVGTGGKGGRAVQTNVAHFSLSDMPQEILGWQQVAFHTAKRDVSDYLGQFSAIWRYRRGTEEVLVAVDYPFWHWHELTDCYEAQGDRLTRRQCVGEGTATVTLSLREIDGTDKYVAFSLFNASGQDLDPPGDAAGVSAYSINRLDRNLESLLLRSQPNYQVQVAARGDLSLPGYLVPLQREALEIIRERVTSAR